MLYTVCTRLSNKEDEACLLSPMVPKRSESIGNVKSTAVYRCKRSSPVVVIIKEKKEEEEQILMKDKKKKIGST